MWGFFIHSAPACWPQATAGSCRSFQILASHKVVQAPPVDVASSLDEEVFSLINSLHDKVSKSLDAPAGVWPGAASFQVHDRSLISSLNEEVSPILLQAWLETSHLRMISGALCMFPTVPRI